MSRDFVKIDDAFFCFVCCAVKTKQNEKKKIRQRSTLKQITNSRMFSCCLFVNCRHSVRFDFSESMNDYSRRIDTVLFAQDFICKDFSHLLFKSTAAAATESMGFSNDDIWLHWCSM